MFKTIWFTIGVFALTGLCVIAPSTVFAQHGPGMHAPVAGAAYDTMTEATFSGTVADIKGGRSALSWLTTIHTLGLGHGGVREKQLLLKTDTGTLQIHLGPTTFLDENKVEVKKGDALEITGSRVAIGESHVVLAREVRKGDIAWTLRDSTGQPLWSVVPTEARGFSTKKKVFLTIVAAKVVLLATVFRH
jgi:hypothetical protein